MRRLQPVALCLALLASAGPARAELVVIANPESGVETLTRDAVVNIYMGRYQKLPSGVTALPVDVSGDKAAFYKSLLGKDLPEVQSYWARLVFSGQGSPPRQMDDPREVIDVVASNRGALGYIERALVDKRVKIVLELPM